MTDDEKLLAAAASGWLSWSMAQVCLDRIIERERAAAREQALEDAAVKAGCEAKAALGEAARHDFERRDWFRARAEQAHELECDIRALKVGGAR